MSGLRASQPQRSRAELDAEAPLGHEAIDVVVDHPHVGRVEDLPPERPDLEAEVDVVEPDRRPLGVVAADPERVLAPVHHAAADARVDLGGAALDLAAVALGDAFPDAAQPLPAAD